MKREGHWDRQLQTESRRGKAKENNGFLIVGGVDYLGRGTRECV